VSGEQFRTPTSHRLAIFPQRQSRAQQLQLKSVVGNRWRGLGFPGEKPTHRLPISMRSPEPGLNSLCCSLCRFAPSLSAPCSAVSFFPPASIWNFNYKILLGKVLRSATIDQAGVWDVCHQRRWLAVQWILLKGEVSLCNILLIITGEARRSIGNFKYLYFKGRKKCGKFNFYHTSIDSMKISLL